MDSCLSGGMNGAHQLESGTARIGKLALFDSENFVFDAHDEFLIYNSILLGRQRGANCQRCLLWIHSSWHLFAQAGRRRGVEFKATCRLVNNPGSKRASTVRYVCP